MEHACSIAPRTCPAPFAKHSSKSPPAVPALPISPCLSMCRTARSIGPTSGATANFGRYPAERAAPDADSVERAARLLRAAARPVFICGGGVVISGAEAELLDARRAALGAGGDDHQRQRVDRRKPSARRRRGRLQRRHTGNPRDRRSGRSDRFRRLPRRLGDHRALAPSRAGDSESYSPGCGCSRSWDQLSGRRGAGRRRAARFKNDERSAREPAAPAGSRDRAKGQGTEICQVPGACRVRQKNRSSRSG